MCTFSNLLQNCDFNFSSFNLLYAFFDEISLFSTCVDFGFRSFDAIRQATSVTYDIDTIKSESIMNRYLYATQIRPKHPWTIYFANKKNTQKTKKIIDHYWILLEYCVKTVVFVISIAQYREPKVIDIDSS